MKTKILSINGNVLFTWEGAVSLRTAVEIAVSKRVSLARADLSYVNLANADLRGAYLAGANLSGADLSGADLQGAYLSRADLNNANLSSANLDKVYTNENTSFFSPQCPSEGSFIGWKKAGDYIVKLLITEDAKRSSATSLKCRCSKAKVLDIQDVDGESIENIRVNSNYNNSFSYEVGKVVEVKDFDENRWNECSTGVHFFIARENAVNYI